MAWSDAVITTKGLDLLADLIAGEELILSSAVAGTGTVAPTALITQTELVSPLADVPVYIASVKDLTEGSGKQIKLQIRNTGVTEAHRMNQLGIFAQVNGESVLFAIMQDDIGENIPTESEYLDFMIEFTAAIALSQTDGITVVVDAKAYMTFEDVENMIKSRVSNKNLLINPDLSINQRGQEEYAGKNIYTVDHWRLHATDGTIFNVADKTIIIPQNDNPAWYGILQYLDYDLAGETVTVSADVETDVDIYIRFTYGTSNSNTFTKLIPAGYSGVVEMCNCVIPEATTRFSVQLTNLNKPTAGGRCKVNWGKVEIGSVATPFIPPDPAIELVKCQRFYQVRSTGDIAFVDLRPSMSDIVDVMQREDGTYEYVAEL